jgi:hypothetical protein
MIAFCRTQHNTQLPVSFGKLHFDDESTTYRGKDLGSKSFLLYVIYTKCIKWMHNVCPYVSETSI